MAVCGNDSRLQYWRLPHARLGKAYAGASGVLYSVVAARTAEGEDIRLVLVRLPRSAMPSHTSIICDAIDLSRLRIGSSIVAYSMLVLVPGRHVPLPPLADALSRCGYDVHSAPELNAVIGVMGRGGANTLDVSFEPSHGVTVNMVFLGLSVACELHVG